MNLLYRDSCPVNDWLSIRIPTVEEILEQEDAYYGMVSMLTAMPVDMIAQLDSIGIDFTEISEYDLFLMTMWSLRGQDTSLIFGGMDLRRFQRWVNPQNGMQVLRDPQTGAMIDRGIQERIAAALRKIHGMKKNYKKPGNAEAKTYMIERARIKYQRSRRRTEDTSLEGLIVALVNTEQFPYDFQGVRALTIYQFNESLRQVVHKINYDNRMHGVYAGTVVAKDLRPADWNWMNHQND